MEKLTKAQVRALAFIAQQPVLGPLPGWNADCELAPEGVEPIDGSDCQALFSMGYLAATPAPPPHTEDFNEESGSIVRDHEWHITDAGRAALEASNG